MVEHGVLCVYVLPTEVQRYLFMYQSWSKNKRYPVYSSAALLGG